MLGSKFYFDYEKNGAENCSFRMNTMIKKHYTSILKALVILGTNIFFVLLIIIIKLVAKTDIFLFYLFSELHKKFLIKKSIYRVFPGYLLAF